MKESTIQTRILLRASETGARLFRNNVGKGWTGTYVQLDDGSILIRNPRRINYGLCVGSSDLIGWTPVEVTEDMVGQTVAIFTGIEVKTPKGRPTEDQQRFLSAVNSAGGVGMVGRDPEEVKRTLSDLCHK